MAEQDYAYTLRWIAGELVVEGGEDNRYRDAVYLAEAANHIEKLEAEIERLTPKSMTLDRAVQILNERERSQVRYEIVGSCVYPFLGRNQLVLEPLTEFVAIAVAEKVEREKDVVND